MHAENFALPAYFDRIGFSGAVRADIDTVTAIMRCQLFSVPFENLDVQAGKIVSLIPEDIVDKILVRKRGGYCYETNGIFALALSALGIAFRFVAARPLFGSQRKPKTHMALVVHCDGDDWLCDLGFGSYGLRAPLRMSQTDVAVRQDDDSFMLSKVNEAEYTLRALVGGRWVSQYCFDLCPQEWVDFTLPNYFNSTHRESIFVRKLLLVQHTPQGREIFFDGVLKSVVHGITHKQTVPPSGRAAMLRDIFHLDGDLLAAQK